MFYAQKLKCNFFKESDRGTSFFHALMNQRHKKNFISAVRDTSGSLTTSTDEFGEVLVQYFQQLLGTSYDTQPLDESVVCCGPRLEEATHVPPLAVVSNDESK
jgi:hypothetical protein